MLCLRKKKGGRFAVSKSFSVFSYAMPKLLIHLKEGDDTFKKQFAAAKVFCKVSLRARNLAEVSWKTPTESACAWNRQFDYEVKSMLQGVEIQVQVLKKGFFSPTVLAEARCNLIDGVPEDIWLPVASVNGGSSSPCTKQPSKAKTGDCPMVHLTITSEGQVVPPVVYDSKYTVISQLGSGNFGK
ncbi:hypothetical protein CYMTET_26699, partial [Cymbomonas tetramitiformis]